MSKFKAQGTAWETEFVRRCHDAGLLADRMPEGGMNDAGDCWIGDTPKHSDSPYSDRDISVLAWSRLINTGTTRRVADGARSVVVIDTDDFLHIARHAIEAGVSFTVECKAREVLNVTRELDKAKKKLARWKAPKPVKPPKPRTSFDIEFAEEN